MLVLILVFVITLIIGIPISFCLGISAVMILLVGDLGVSPFLFVPQQAFRAMDSFPLLAIPFFVLAGELMGISITPKLVSFARAFIGRIRGGLSYVTVLTCMFFGGVTGVGVAETAAIGSVMIPAMQRDGYSRGFSAGVVAASSTLGPIIPPSVPMVIYALSVGGSISVASLFLGGVIPGILLGISFMVASYIIAIRRDFPISQENFSFRRLIVAFKEAFWALMMPIIIVGGIISGFFTATESAVVAVVYALIVRFLVYRDLKWKELPNHFVQAGIVTSVVLFLMGMASLVAWIITINNVPHLLVTFIKSITSNPDIFLFLIVALLLIAGCFIDSASNIVMFAPILAPLGAAFGIHPIHFGILVIVTLILGMITPPVGVILFVASGISGEKFEVIVRNIFPFLYSSAVVLALMVMFPKLVLFVPSLFGY